MLKTPNTKSAQPKSAQPKSAGAKPAELKSAELKSAEVKSAEVRGGKTRIAQPAASAIVAKTAMRPGARRTAGAGADLQQRIQQRAYELWENEGRPQGRESAHWQQAEREVQGRGAGGRA